MPSRVHDLLCAAYWDDYCTCYCPMTGDLAKRLVYNVIRLLFCRFVCEAEDLKKNPVNEPLSPAGLLAAEQLLDEQNTEQYRVEESADQLIAELDHPDPDHGPPDNNSVAPLPLTSSEEPQIDTERGPSPVEAGTTQEAVEHEFVSQRTPEEVARIEETAAHLIEDLKQIKELQQEELHQHHCAEHLIEELQQAEEAHHQGTEQLIEQLQQELSHHHHHHHHITTEFGDQPEEETLSEGVASLIEELKQEEEKYHDSQAHLLDHFKKEEFSHHQTAADFLEELRQDELNSAAALIEELKQEELTNQQTAADLLAELQDEEGWTNNCSEEDNKHDDDHPSEELEEEDCTDKLVRLLSQDSGLSSQQGSPLQGAPPLRHDWSLRGDSSPPPSPITPVPAPPQKVQHRDCETTDRLVELLNAPKPSSRRSSGSSKNTSFGHPNNRDNMSGLRSRFPHQRDWDDEPLPITRAQTMPMYGTSAPSRNPARPPAPNPAPAAGGMAGLLTSPWFPRLLKLLGWLLWVGKNFFPWVCDLFRRSVLQ